MMDIVNSVYLHFHNDYTLLRSCVNCMCQLGIELVCDECSDISMCYKPYNCEHGVKGWGYFTMEDQNLVTEQTAG